MNENEMKEKTINIIRRLELFLEDKSFLKDMTDIFGVLENFNKELTFRNDTIIELKKEQDALKSNLYDVTSINRDLVNKIESLDMQIAGLQEKNSDLLKKNRELHDYFDKSSSRSDEVIRLRRQRETLLDNIRQIQDSTNELDRAFRNEFPELEFTKILREIATKISLIAREAL